MRALLEARDILERAAPAVGAVDPDDLGALIEEARSRYIERVGRYNVEPTHEAETEALRAAVEPLARLVIGQQISLEAMWADYCFRLATDSPKDAFAAVIRPAVSAVGPARRQRTALRRICALLESATDTVSAEDLRKVIRDSGLPLTQTDVGQLDTHSETFKPLK